MNNNNIKYSFNLLFVFLFLLVIPQLENAQAQTFNLGEREYLYYEGKWYNFTRGAQGDQMVPYRLIVRLKDHGDLRMFDFAQVGLSNIKVVSDELFGYQCH